MNTNKRSRGGRPPLLDIEKRSVKFHGGFTLAEAESIAKKAKAVGLSESEYVRHAILNRDIKSVPQVNKDTYVELGHIGTNINQIAHALNSGTEYDKARLKAVFEQLIAAIGRIRKQVIGVSQ